MNKGYNQNNMNISNMSNMPDNTGEFMYPEVYKNLQPHCSQIIQDMEKQYGNIYLTEDLLNQMTDEAIRRSGMMEENMPENMNKMDNMGMEPMTYSANDDDPPPSIPTARPFRRHESFRRNRQRRFFDYDGLSDIAKILFLQEIFGRRRPYWLWR